MEIAATIAGLLVSVLALVSGFWKLISHVQDMLDALKANTLAVWTLTEKMGDLERRVRELEATSNG